MGPLRRQGREGGAIYPVADGILSREVSASSPPAPRGPSDVNCVKTNSTKGLGRTKDGLLEEGIESDDLFK